MPVSSPNDLPRPLFFLFRKSILALMLRFILGFLVGAVCLAAATAGMLAVFLYQIPFGTPLVLFISCSLVGTLFVLSMWADRVEEEELSPSKENLS